MIQKQQGLSAKEAEALLASYGYNTLPEKPQPSWFWVFFTQFASPLIYILVLAAMLIFFVANDPLDAFIIGGILLFNAIVGTIQEGRTRKILISLKRFIVQQCIVIRDDKKTILDASELVPGDLIIVQEGQRVPADARVIESHQLRIDEAMLTGESVPVQKHQDAIIYSGTSILSGWGKAIVVAIGINTELGKIHQSVQEIQTDVPLAQEMARLSWWIFILFWVFAAFFFLSALLPANRLKSLW